MARTATSRAARSTVPGGRRRPLSIPGRRATSPVALIRRDPAPAASRRPLSVLIAVPVLFVVLAAFTAACTTNSAGAGTASTLPTVVARTLRNHVDTVLRDNHVPGAIVGVWVPGKGSWVATRGVADRSTRRPIKAGDAVRIASITKSFVATVVLQLRDDGRLRLTDHLSRWVPDFPQADAITVRQLLNHTGGVYPYFDDAAFRQAIEADPLKVWTEDELIDIARGHGPLFEPGASWHYSDTGYILLQRIVEQVTGHGLPDVIRRRVLEPLGLKHTGFPSTPALPAPHAHGYWQKPGTTGLTDVTRLDPSMALGSGAMVSTLDDLARWTRAVATGRLLSRSSHRLQLRGVRMSALTETRYGLGIFLTTDAVGGSGDIYGFNSAAYYYPKDRSVIVVLLNRCDMTKSVADPLLSWLHRSLVAYGL